MEKDRGQMNECFHVDCVNKEAESLAGRQVPGWKKDQDSPPPVLETHV